MDVSYGAYKGRACRGMTKQEVVEIIGLPGIVKRTATHEQWVYGDKLLYFDNNQLVEFLDLAERHSSTVEIGIGVRTVCVLFASMRAGCNAI